MFCTGSSLSNCTFDGQQCCSQDIINFANTKLKKDINEYVVNHLTTKIKAIKDTFKPLRDKAKSMYIAMYVNIIMTMYVCYSVC